MIVEEEDEIYQVEKIVDKKWFDDDRCYKYLVKWEGYDDDENTWEPVENLDQVGPLLQKFEKNLSRKENAQYKRLTDSKA
jgi:hypothetical protein